MQSTHRPAAGANSPVDGYVARGSVNQTLANIRAGAGTSAQPTATSALVALQSSATTNQYTDLARGILCFDTSSIPDDAIILSATIRLRGIFKQNGLGSPDLHITSASPASSANLVSADYGTLGSTSFGSISYASFSDSAYNEIALDSNGLAHISKTGVTSFGVRTSWDLTGTFTGTWGAFLASQLWWSTADETGTGQDPELVVTYALPAEAERGARLIGMEFADDERGATLVGGVAADSERPATLHGFDVTDSDRSAKLTGVRPFADRGAKVTGFETASSIRGATLLGRIPTEVQSSRGAKITGRLYNKRPKIGAIKEVVMNTGIIPSAPALGLHIAAPSAQLATIDADSAFHDADSPDVDAGGFLFASKALRPGGVFWAAPRGGV